MSSGRSWSDGGITGVGRQGILAGPVCRAGSSFFNSSRTRSSRTACVKERRSSVGECSGSSSIVSRASSGWRSRKGSAMLAASAEGAMRRSMGSARNSARARASFESAASIRLKPLASKNLWSSDRTSSRGSMRRTVRVCEGATTAPAVSGSIQRGSRTSRQRLPLVRRTEKKPLCSVTILWATESAMLSSSCGTGSKGASDSVAGV